MLGFICASYLTVHINTGITQLIKQRHDDHVRHWSSLDLCVVYACSGMHGFRPAGGTVSTIIHVIRTRTTRTLPRDSCFVLSNVKIVYLFVSMMMHIIAVL